MRRGTIYDNLRGPTRYSHIGTICDINIGIYKRWRKHNGMRTYPKPARFVLETAVDELGHVVDEVHCHCGRFSLGSLDNRTLQFTMKTTRYCCTKLDRLFPRQTPARTRVQVPRTAAVNNKNCTPLDRRRR